MRDRVRGLERVPARRVKPHPLNARRHSEAQRRALREAIDKIGFAGAFIAVKRGDDFLLLDGHLRLTELAEDDRVPVLVLDLDDDEVEAFLATYDAIGRMADYDPEALQRLMTQVNDQPNLSAILAAIAEDAQHTAEAPFGSLEELQVSSKDSHLKTLLITVNKADVEMIEAVLDAVGEDAPPEANRRGWALTELCRTYKSST